MKSLKCLCLSAVAVAFLATATVKAADAPKPAAPNVDVVLCLDVSGSMQGLIDSAKVKLWDIVNDLGKVKPTPNLRVSLYSYGATNYPAASGWVRKECDLTTDLDTVYKKLTALTINGGNEYVARVCQTALNDQKWSEDKKALKIIFVCGNEPANQDKQVALDVVSKLAISKDVVVNTIYCGSAANAEADGWRQFAKMSEGSFASIDQNRGAVAIATPHDAKLQELSGKLNTTYVAYGKKELRQEKTVNQQAADASSGKSSPSAGASRALSKAGGLYRNSEWDVIDRLKEDPKFDITKVPEDELCDEMKKLKPAERVEYVNKKKAEREAIQKDIQEISKLRADYLSVEMKKNAKAGDNAFDQAVRKTLKDQANRKGIQIPE